MKAAEIQAYADRRDSKKFYESLKGIYGLRSCGSSPVFEADKSTLVMDKPRILARALWRLTKSTS